MVDFKSIVGHERIIQHLKKAILMDKVSHAYIFAGEDGSGKTMLSDGFALSLQCENRQVSGEACGSCISCMQGATDNHPDIIKVTHDKASIGVDDIRIQVNNDILIKPYSSPYKIYIIDEAEKLTEQAQNALLKTIEEPPYYAVVILLSNNVNALLQTILSRCVTLQLQAVDKERIKEHLMVQYQIPDYLAGLSCLFAGGNVGRAIQYATSEEFSKVREKTLHILRNINDIKVYEIIEEIKDIAEDKNKIYDYLDFFVLWYRDVLVFKATKDPNLLTYKSEVMDITKHGIRISYEGIQQILDAIDKAKSRLRANVNFDITMELMLFTIKEMGHD